MSIVFFFSSRRRHTRCSRDWSSDVCSSDLAAVIRVTTSDLGLTMKAIRGTHVAFYVPEQKMHQWVVPQGYDYGEILTEGAAIRLPDAAYEFQLEATGYTPFGGGIQYLVNDPGHGTDGTVPCGLSGNLIR